MLLPLLFALSLGAGLQDPVRVTATLSSSRINVGESTTLQISVETPGDAPDEIRVPVLPAELHVMGTGDFSQTQLSIPGGRSRLTRRDVILSPARAGVYRIPPVAVRARGRMYYTTPLELVVDDGPATPRGGFSSADAGPRLSLFLVPDTVYLGEQVLLQSEAVFPDEMRLRQTRPASFDPPAPPGFWVQDLPNPITVSLRVLDGRTVEIQNFRRAYFPLSAGTFTFPPARLHYELRRGFLYAPESRQIESDSARLIVLPLPDSGRPASFSGAVGSLTMRAELAPRRLNLGDAATLVIELEGSGNVKALPEPKLPQLAGVEVFPPSQDSRVDITNSLVGGNKRFRWVLVPERPGRVVIPPIEYAYFDPAERKYQVLRTDSLLIEAIPVVTSAVGDTTLRPLRQQTRPTSLGWIRSPGFAALQVAPLLALVSLIALRRRRERPPSQKEVRARVAGEIEALRTSGAGSSFLGDLERTLERGVREVLGGTGEAAAQLRAAGAAATADRLLALTAELRRLRYAPAARFDRNALVDQALAIVNSIPVSRRGRTQSALLLALLLGAPLAASGVLTAAQADATPWDEGIAAFAAGDYVQAAHSFREHARAHPRSADAWYNYGLAAYRADDPGRAVWAWLRAIRFAPRDADISHNLRVAGAASALARIQPADRLALDERLLLAAAAWWLLAAAIALRILRRRGALWIGVPALAIGAYALITAATATWRPLYVTPLRTGTELLAAPHMHAESLGRLEPGSIVRVRARRIGYVLVAIDEVRDAWVDRSAIAAP